LALTEWTKGNEVPIRRGRIEVFHDDQLIVPLRDQDVMTRTLHAAGVQVGSAEQSAALGLTLLRDLSGISPAVRSLREDPEIGPGLRQAEQERASLGGPGPADLDLLVAGIGLQFARKYPGWQVQIGKNYRASQVKGYPHIGGGSEGDPEPSNAPLPGGDVDPALGRGVRVWLLDTRLFPDPRLSGHYIARAEDLLDPAQELFTMFDGHCAFVGSCILGQAPAAELHLRPVLDSANDGSAWDAAVAIAEIAQMGVDVVNLSFGEIHTDDNSAPMVLEHAVRRFGPETVVVAAAGNNGDIRHLPADLVLDGLEPGTASYPAALEDVIGVGALDRNGSRAAFTPHPAPWVALLAPGVGLTGAYVRGMVTIEHQDRTGRVLDSKPVSFPGTATWQGCSFAAGVVSGAIAAGTVPGHRSSREVLNELLQAGPGDQRAGIQPSRADDSEG
jgi:membrane-anchored mycosin MYCP